MKFGPVSFIDIRSIAWDIAKHIIENWGRWSEMVAVKSPHIMSGSITFWKYIIYVSIRIVVILVGCKIKGINDLETRESKNSLSDYAHYNWIG